MRSARFTVPRVTVVILVSSKPSPVTTVRRNDLYTIARSMTAPRSGFNYVAEICKNVPTRLRRRKTCFQWVVVVFEGWFVKGGSRSGCGHVAMFDEWWFKVRKYFMRSRLGLSAWVVFIDSVLSFQGSGLIQIE
nr:hypothetical protein [Tanacetum cinerariifolium]